jgi:hypothetical protein
VAGHLFRPVQLEAESDLAKAFAQIAFSSYIRPNNFVFALPPQPPNDLCALPSTKWRQVCGRPNEYKESYPWLYEYLYRDKGVPRYFAINKFTGPIRISIGYPNDLFPVLPGDERLNCKDFAAKVAKHFKAILMGEWIAGNLECMGRENAKSDLSSSH